MEMRIDNLQMDMTGVELSVANAHLQVQRLEDDVVQGLKERIETAEEGISTWRGIFSQRWMPLSWSKPGWK